MGGGGYIDVGANHPTRISNSYLLYRNGVTGIVIEPNREMAKLHLRFRALDHVIAVGCGRSSGIAPFHVSTTPVLSAFGQFDHPGSKILRTEWIPILTLDEIWIALGRKPVFLLSIDTEGFEKEVLLGAPMVLEATTLVVLEANNVELLNEMKTLIGRQFIYERQFGCNYVFRNSSLGGVTAPPNVVD